MNMLITAQHGSKAAVSLDADNPAIIIDALAQKMGELDAMETDGGLMPDRMRASDLNETELFQVRDGINNYHVDSLVRALELDGDLQPLLVLRRGGQAYLVDGWHRKRAYEAARRNDSIPVVEFHGTSQEALLEGQRLNKLHTLAMTKDERMNGAWKLVKLDAAKACRFTLPQIMAAGVSRGQVTLMRRVYRELNDGSVHPTWRAALRTYSRKPDRDWTEAEIEELLEAQAQEAADKFARVNGTRLADRPEIMARMIEIYTGRRITDVVQILTQRNNMGNEDEGDCDF